MSIAIRPKKNNNPKSKIKWGLSSTWAPLSPSPHTLFSSLCVLFSFSSCCAFLHVASLLFTRLLSSSPCYSPLHATALLFTLMFSSLCCLFSSCCCSPFLLFFYFKYKVFCGATFLFSSPLCVVVVGVLLLIEDSCITPLHSFLQQLGMVGS